MAFNPQYHETFFYRVFGFTVPKREFRQTVGICLAVVTAILFIVLLSLSIKTLNYDEVALTYNKVSRELGSTVLREGRHVVAPADVMKTFSATVLDSETELDCVSQDGLVIGVRQRTQFFINQDELRTILYDHYDQDGLRDVVQTCIHSSIRDACGTFTGENYFGDRSGVEITMNKNVTTLLANGFHVKPTFLQLENLNMPAAFQAAVQNAQLAKESVDIALNQRPGLLIKKQTEYLQAVESGKSVVIQGEADARSIIFAAATQTASKIATWNERANQAEIEMTSLNLNASEYLRTYLRPRIDLLYRQAVPKSTQLCLEQCPTGACWWCWTNAQVVVNP